MEFPQTNPDSPLGLGRGSASPEELAVWSLNKIKVLLARKVGRGNDCWSITSSDCFICFFNVNSSGFPFAATWVDLKIVILSEVKSDKDKYYMISLIHGISKRGTNELIYKTEIELQM